MSKLKFSAREHTNIVNCSLGQEEKVAALIDTLELCDEKVFEDFCEVLKSLKMKHVIRELEIGKTLSCTSTEKRKHDSLDGMNNILLNLFGLVLSRSDTVNIIWRIFHEDQSCP